MILRIPVLWLAKVIIILYVLYINFPKRWLPCSLFLFPKLKPDLLKGNEKSCLNTIQSTNTNESSQIIKQESKIYSSYWWLKKVWLKSLLIKIASIQTRILLTGNPSFCTTLAYFLAASLDWSSLRKTYNNTSEVFLTAFKSAIILRIIWKSQIKFTESFKWISLKWTKT